MKEEIREIRKYLEINEKIIQQNLWDAAKAVLGGNFPTLKNILKSQNNLTFYIKNVNE